ncbi:hypothetical protein MPSEU_000224500 [Mayamaea pseudoterrestris]|nr:hypothetical protein MPSEU_000224500 [Mayamaea pseudoterrestris]
MAKSLTATTTTTTTSMMRKPADMTTSLDRCKSEKTVDTTLMSRGESRSSLYSRNSSSRHSLCGSSARSLSSKSIVATTRLGSERSLASAPKSAQSAASRNDSHAASMRTAAQHETAAATSPDRRVRKLGYTEEEKLLLECQSPQRIDSSSSANRKPSRIRKMLSWVAPKPMNEDDHLVLPRCSSSRSENGCYDLFKTPAAAAPRRRSAVFIKTSNGLSEGILYR